VTVALVAVTCVLVMIATGVGIAADVNGNLSARKPVPKTPSAELEMPPDATGRLRVKFNDNLLVRTTVGGEVFSLSNQNLAHERKVFDRYGLTAIPAINKTPEALLALQMKAQARSGREQPDLAGIFTVTGPLDSLEAAARALNDLATVEWVTYEVEKLPGRPPMPGPLFRGPGQNDFGDEYFGGHDIGRGTDEPAEGGLPGACCGPDGSCQILTESVCVSIPGGIWHGDVSPDCTDVMECEGICCLDDGTCVASNNEAGCPAGSAWSGPADLDGDGMLDFDCVSGRCGACCLPNLTCTPLRQVDCLAIDGAVFQGAGSTCTGTECGACCVGTECFAAQTNPRCTAIGGIYAGDFVSCSAAACGGVDACCLPDGTCVEGLTTAECVAGMGTPFPGVTCALQDCRIFACCIDEECVLLRRDQCDASNGNWDEGQATCEDVECDDQCGEPITGSCFDPAGNPSPYCSNLQCCQLICELDPFCCDADNFGFWDPFCAAEANALCSPHESHCPGPPEVNGPDHCASALTGSCFEAHFGGGCNNEDCCNSVCMVDPFCCDFLWLAGCVETALVVCATPIPPGAATPDYTSLQGYTTQPGYNPAALNPVLKPFLPIVRTYTPPDTKCDIPPLTPPMEDIFQGYGGQGLDIMTQGEDFTDLNGNGWWDPGEPFVDRGNGVFDPDEWDVVTQDVGFVDPPNVGFGAGNGVYDGPEIYTDTNGNSMWDPGEPLLDLDGDSVWDSGEPFTDANGNLVRDPSLDQWDPATQDVGVDGIPFTGDCGEGDGMWTGPEAYTDFNGNGQYDVGEPFADSCFGAAPCDAANPSCNQMRDPGEPFMDSGNLQWDPPGGIWGIAEQLLNGTPPADATGLGNLTRGRGAKVAVIEWAYWPDHEDLNVIGEPGQTMILIPEITQPDHGTACLGIMNALDNGIGVTGMVPEAEAYFFPLTSVEEGPREMSAWTSALETLGAGDVISASYGPGPPIGNLNNDQAMNTLFQVATDLGITVCVAAGNDCFNLDNAQDLGDSGAVVVGACSPGSPHYRLSFSNFCTGPSLERSNIVHLKAWGEAVATCGYGVLPLPDGDPNRSYTPVFGGTSAACPQVASVMTMLQGMSKQFYGIALQPQTLRSAMGAPGTPPPNPQRLFGGFPQGQQCNLDLDPDEGPHMIGVYTQPDGAAGTLLSQTFAGFDDAPLLEDVVIVKGLNVRGNRFAVKGSDNLYLKLDPQYVSRNDAPGFPFGGQGVGGGAFGGSVHPQVSQITYLASGWMTDIVAVGRSDLPTVGTLILENEMAWPNVFAFMMVEMYDWQQLDWAFVDVRTDVSQAEGIQPDNGDAIFEHSADGASRFVNPADDRILCRIWTLGFPAFQGGVGGGDTTFISQTDLLNIFVAEGFGVPLP
jgi:hypothetical protein